MQKQRIPSEKKPERDEYIVSKNRHLLRDVDLNIIPFYASFYSPWTTSISSCFFLSFQSGICTVRKS